MVRYAFVGLLMLAMYATYQRANYYSNRESGNFIVYFNDEVIYRGNWNDLLSKD